MNPAGRQAYMCLKFFSFFSHFLFAFNGVQEIDSLSPDLILLYMEFLYSLFFKFLFSMFFSESTAWEFFLKFVLSFIFPNLLPIIGMFQNQFPQ